MKFRVAIIGCGNIAGGYDKAVPVEWTFTHAGAYRLCSETELVAVHDILPEAMTKFKEKWGPVNCYENLEELLERENPHIVSICCSTENHAAVFQAVCRYDVPALFCEKPLSYDLEEARRMIRFSGERIVGVNYFRRWNTTLQELKNRIDEGQFGELISIRAIYTKGFTHNASHIIDLILWFFGPVEGVKVMKCQHSTPDEGISCQLELSKGGTAVLNHLDSPLYNCFEIDLFFRRGRVLLSQRGQEITEFDLTRDPHYEQFDILQPRETLKTAWKECMQWAVEDIVSCLKNGGEPKSSIKGALATLEVCHRVQEESKKGERV